MSILDHNDHVKAGRAVIIVSVMYIFLNQCVVEFSQIRLLGLDVRISSSEMLSLVRWLLFAYTALFVVRLFQSGVFFRFVAIDSEIQDGLDNQLSQLESYWTLKKRTVERDLRSYLDGLSTTDSNDRKKLASAKAKYDKKTARLSRTHNRQIYRSRIYAAAKTYVDFGFPIFVEVIVPLAFLTVAFFARVDWFVCSAQAAQDATSLLVDLRAWV